MPRERTAVESSAEQAFRVQTGVDISAQNANREQQLTERFSAAGLDAVNRNGNGFAQELLRAADSGDIRTMALLSSCANFRQEDFDLALSGRLVDVAMLNSNAGHVLDTAKAADAAFFISNDQTYRLLYYSVDNQTRAAMDRITTNSDMAQWGGQFSNLEAQLERLPSFTPQVHENFELFVGKVEYTQMRREQGATIQEIGAEIFNVNNREELLDVARQHLPEFLVRRLERAMDYVASDASTGVEAGQIMQENLQMAIEILNMLMEQAQLSKELQDGISEIITEENRKKDEEKYSTIAERMPEGLLREIGDSKDAIEFMEILSGATTYSPEKAAERLEQLISDNSEIREGFARFLVG